MAAGHRHRRFGHGTDMTQECISPVAQLKGTDLFSPPSFLEGRAEPKRTRWNPLRIVAIPRNRSASVSAARLNAAIAEEERRSLAVATRVRLIALPVLTAWVTIENTFPAALFFYPFLVGFALLGILPLWLRNTGRYRRWHRYSFPALDVSLLTVMVLVRNPLEEPWITAQMRLQLGNEVYLFLFLAVAVFSYSPRVVFWTGVFAALAWTAGTLCILALPGSHGAVTEAVWADLSDPERLHLMQDPYFVDAGKLVRQVIAMTVSAAGLAAFVWRSRRLMLRQLEAERERANLSRYFPPNMVEELAQSDLPLTTTRSQPVAVLFADIVGFTALSAVQPPAAVIELLREFHRRMAAAVFDHGGTLDKYLGDGIMATFGTPRIGPSDATNGLRCARAMAESVAGWNQARARRGLAPIGVGIGLHYGPVVLGGVGDENRLEFAVVGDTVNVASRLERLTRTVRASVVVSGDLVDAVRTEGAGAAAALAGFVEAPPQEIRGRQGDMRIWLLTSPGDRPVS